MSRSPPASSAEMNVPQRVQRFPVTGIEARRGGCCATCRSRLARRGLRVIPQPASDDQETSSGPKLSAKGGGGSPQLVAYAFS